MTLTPPRPLPDNLGERGSALVSAVLILLLLTALATGGYWLSRGEMSAAQGYSQSVRALFVAEAGLARYFVSNPSPAVDTMAFEVLPDPCTDLDLYPTMADRAACYQDDEAWEEEFLEEFDLQPPPPRAYAVTDANVYVTSDFIMSDGMTLLFRVRSEARVDPIADPGERTIRVVDTYASLAPPFEVKSVFAATGGVDFGGVDQHHHFDSKAKKGKSGDCGSDVSLTNLQVPSGQFSLPLANPDCPAGKGCPYKWHVKGDGMEVDSSYALGSEIVGEMGLDWDAFLSESYYQGLAGIVELDDSQDFMDYFTKDKDKDFKKAPRWPIVRYAGDIATDQRVKGYGLLVVDGNVTVLDDKIEWTGLMLVGGTINTVGDGHLHVKGAVAAGLSCTDAERASGACRSSLMGDHHDFKYRPCEINQSWSRLMQLRPVSDLYREASPER